MESNDDNRPGGELLVYQGQGLASPVQVRLEGETVWLSQRLLAELFQKDVRTINEHINNIFEDEELLPEATVRKFRIVQTEGSKQAVKRNLIHFPASFRFHPTNQESAQRPHTESRARLAGIERLDAAIHEI